MPQGVNADALRHSHFEEGFDKNQKVKYNKIKYAKNTKKVV